MAESRGKRADGQLKESFRRVYQRGTVYVRREEFAASLSSGELKVKPKKDNIAGLQIADLLANPSFKFVHARRHGREPPDDFGGKIARILEVSKYRRSPTGKLEGFGWKWLP